MHDTISPEPDDTWFEDENEFATVQEQAAVRAGLAGSIHMHEPTKQKAYRDLLEKMFISSNDEAYLLIKTDQLALKQWFRQYPGWHVLQRNDMFRLQRQPGALTSGYGSTKYQLQSARDLAYVGWILWYAANDQIVKRGKGQYFLLPHMLERLTEEWISAECLDRLTLGGDNNFASQPVIMSNRKSMARALNYLQAIRCLEEIDGQIEAWIEQNEAVLYQFTNAIHLLIMSLDTNALQAVTAQQDLATIAAPTMLNSLKEKPHALTRAWRALLLGPFFLRFDDPEAFAALTKHIHTIREEVERAFGWSLEVNHDYACIIREQDVPATSAAHLLNTKNTGDQLIFLLCDALRHQVAENQLHPTYDGYIPTTAPDLLDLFATLREQYGQYWSKSIREKKDKELLMETLRKMRGLGLIRGPDSNSAVLVLAPAARYRTHYRESPVDSASQEQQEQSNFQQTGLWTEEQETDER